MTNEKTLTGKIRDIQYKMLSGTIEKDPVNHLKWLLLNNGIEVSDNDTLKHIIESMFSEYNISKDKKGFNALFEAVVGVSFRDYLNDCLGGEISNEKD